MNTDRFGFSTGALEKGDYWSALQWMQKSGISCLELSALRYSELEPLVNDLDCLPVDGFEYVSFHAPSSIDVKDEERVISLLEHVAAKHWNIIVHPDIVYTPHLWKRFGSFLLLENMDRRKSVGRNVEEMELLFDQLPDAQMCLDLAHARQLDTTLTLLWNLAERFDDRVKEIHISELDSRCQHRPLTRAAISDYQKIAPLLRDVPVIIESVIDKEHSKLRLQEIAHARNAMGQFEKIDGLSNSKTRTLE